MDIGKNGQNVQKETSPMDMNERSKGKGEYMSIDLLFKIAAIGILVAVLYQVLVRAGREDQAMMTTLAGLVIVLTMVIKEISGLFDTVRTLFNL